VRRRFFAYFVSSIPIICQTFDKKWYITAAVREAQFSTLSLHDGQSEVVSVSVGVCVGVHESERRMNLIYKPTPSPSPTIS
jgi:hypothetical protein